jgi:chemotaxis signal transduction protein
LTLPVSGSNLPDKPERPERPERRQRARSGPSLQALFFSVPQVLLCLPLESVHKVLAMVALQEVPDAPPHVIGLLNLAGEAVPVVDLCLLLKRPHFEYSVDTPILLCERNGRRCGVVAEAVSGVGHIENSQRRMGELVRDGRAPFLTVFEAAAGLVFMLDLDTVCDGLQMDLTAGTLATTTAASA